MRIVLLIIAALWLTPSPLFAQAKKSAPTALSKAALAAEIDPAVITALRSAFAAQRAKGTYRALMDNSIGGNVLPSLELQAVYPNRIRLKRSGLEMVFVEGKGMVRKGDKWEPAPASLAKSIGGIDDPEEDEKMLSNATLAKSLGTTKIDNRVLATYEVHTKGKNGIAKAKFYISLDDSLIRRIETKSEFQGKPVFSTMIVGDYGVPLQIDLPK